MERELVQGADILALFKAKKPSTCKEVIADAENKLAMCSTFVQRQIVSKVMKVPMT